MKEDQLFNIKLSLRTCLLLDRFSIKEGPHGVLAIETGTIFEEGTVNIPSLTLELNEWLKTEEAFYYMKGYYAISLQEHNILLVISLSKVFSMTKKYGPHPEMKEESSIGEFGF